ncbi:TraB/GumN family protein [Roseovarius sp.]|uniref:TraB/GumN family protein n=1 Tax=Roseovarius sp. TaxID=1486281 RepID=UPI00263032F8|nr:TraB/GumN family protein [Roseovarius sp.]MDM8167497.1 TraB/GumN family protein [Roseovarius sp.]
MLRLVAVILLVLQPVAAFALCEGKDLIDAMPEAERQEVQARADATPYPEGLLWRAERGDTEITIFGTYHFRHAETGAHLERLKPLIDAADSVYLEMSLEDQKGFQAELASDPSIMFITEGETLPDLLGEADWQHFKAEMEARMIPGFMAAKFKPLWAAMMLGIGPCEARNGGLEGGGIDEMVGEYATEQGLGSHSLEDFAEVLTTLDTEPPEKQIEMIRMTLAWPGDANDMSYTIRERYLQQEVALMWEFSRAVSLKYGGPTAEEDFARLERIFLTARNAAWIDKLMAEVPGQKVVLAAGAGHLPGEIGILYLLEQEGFTIERLPLRP